jgi:hypothetical protein
VKESGLVLIGEVYIAEHTSTKRHVCSAMRERRRERGGGRERERGRERGRERERYSC